ncbi:MAG: hypothetical protein CFE44_09845 [Burkholderiales bacterium PBB4]|nr:MAG: hypothetical protein CFE44_09845 [Burkholderiales bacterium PBB4]
MFWQAVNPPPKPEGLPAAIKRRMGMGQMRYTFVHDHLEIDDLSQDVSTRYFKSPRDYGFTVREYDGARTAWARDFENGTMLVTNVAGDSHVLSPKLPARIIFLDPTGYPLQDTGALQSADQRDAEVVKVRMTITATYDLQGAEPEAARSALIALLDETLVDAMRFSEEKVRLLDHAFESSSLLIEDHKTSSDTDFSKLLDL